MVLSLALYLTACVALCTGAPSFSDWQIRDNDPFVDPFQRYRDSQYSQTEEAYIMREKGDDACDRSLTLAPCDRISQKFYDDHICLVRKDPPKNLDLFCDDFRNLPLYQVMILTTSEIKQLRNDLGNHQEEFYENRAHYPPVKRTLPSTMYFYTDNTYNFIECRNYKGKKLNGYYQLYVPRGTDGNPEGNYQIYHGCAPRSTRPGFSANGQC